MHKGAVLKTLLFYTFLFIFMSHSLVHVASILQFRQPTPQPQWPLFLTLAESTLLFDRQKFFFERKKYAIHYTNRVVSFDGKMLGEFIPYLETLLFSHSVYGSTSSDIKAAILKHYFCDIQIQKKIFPDLSGQPLSADWFLEDVLPPSKTLIQSVECN